MPLQGREGKREKKSIIVELLSLSVPQITCAEEKKEITTHSIPRPQLYSKTMAGGRKREQTSVG